jgi:uncharacterized protein YndB with AHSA1/START domain
VASSVSSSVIINRPIEDVFAVLTNVENAGKWFPTQVEEWWTSPPRTEWDLPGALASRWDP